MMNYLSHIHINYLYYLCTICMYDNIYIYTMIWSLWLSSYTIYVLRKILKSFVDVCNVTARTRVLPGEVCFDCAGRAFGMSSNCPNGWRDLFPKHETLNHKPCILNPMTGLAVGAASGATAGALAGGATGAKGELWACRVATAFTPLLIKYGWAGKSPNQVEAVNIALQSPQSLKDNFKIWRLPCFRRLSSIQSSPPDSSICEQDLGTGTAKWKYTTVYPVVRREPRSQGYTHSRILPI